MRILIAFLLGPALLSLWPASGEAAQLPTLPQAFIDTTYSPPSGNTIVVNAGGNLQTAINNAVPGDTIVLQAGATFSGPFTLPNKVGSAWIYIRSSAYASLPPPGTRVSIADAANMPKIVGTTAGINAILTNAQAHNYRFVGIEIRPATGLFITNLVAIGGGETSLANLPHDITFDRCYIHGDPTVGGRRGIAMNGASVAVVDSYISDFKEVGSDSQALWSYNSPGPLKIVNNYLEAAAENVMFGGADPAIANLVPSDIEIRRNHFFKPLSWIPLTWTVKNLLEFKNAQRILVEGNLFENIWAAAQAGYLLNAKSVNQDGACTWCIVQDLTFRNNRGKNLENGLSLSGDEQPIATAPTRWLFSARSVSKKHRGFRSCFPRFRCSSMCSSTACWRRTRLHGIPFNAVNCGSRGHLGPPAWTGSSRSLSEGLLQGRFPRHEAFTRANGGKLIPSRSSARRPCR